MTKVQRAAARQRLFGMVRKETLQILRDPSSIAIAFVLPVVLLFLFGYGVSLDARDIPLGIVIEQPDAATQSLAGSFAHSDYFKPQYYRNIQPAEKALQRGDIDGIVWLQNNFSMRLLSGNEAPIAVRVNGVNSNQANLTQGYIQGVWQTWLQLYATAQGKKLTIPVRIKYRIWFNQAVTSRLFLVPGLIAIIMTLIGSLLTAMVIAREWERGTMEAMLVTPLHISEILLGKLIPYFILGMGGMLYTVVLAIWLFNVPFRGSILALSLAGALFMLVSLAVGLLISIVSKNQFVAGQIAIVVTFLPAFILSGFIFDISSMPAPIQLLTHIVPARYFVTLSQTLFLSGNVWPVYWNNMAALLIMLVIFFLLVRKKAHKRLE